MRPATKYCINLQFNDYHFAEIWVHKAQLEPVLKSLPYKDIIHMSVNSYKEIDREEKSNETVCK